MDNLTPSDLFSPSKARQQRAQAADWAQIDSWLAYKYSGRTVPPFERNADTLKALRELCAANERADEEKVIRERVERQALKEYDEIQRPEQTTRILSALRSNLTPEGEASLHAIASTAVILNTPSAHPEAIAHALIQHTATVQNLSNQLEHIQTLQSYVAKQQTLLRRQLDDLKSDIAFAAPSGLVRQTTENARQTKHIRTKIREAEDRLSSLQSQQSRHNSTPSSRDAGSADALAEMLEQQQGLDELRIKVEGLEAQVKEFEGLPADREAARKDVGKLEVRLDEARRRRDELFEGLVDK